MADNNAFNIENIDAKIQIYMGMLERRLFSERMANKNEYAKNMRKAAESANALEVQLQSSLILSETNAKLNKTMSEYIEKVNMSATSTEALNHQIADLSKRMTALNTVYGNMLSAMNVKS